MHAGLAGAQPAVCEDQDQRSPPGVDFGGDAFDLLDRECVASTALPLGRRRPVRGFPVMMRASTADVNTMLATVRAAWIVEFGSPATRRCPSHSSISIRRSVRGRLSPTKGKT